MSLVFSRKLHQVLSPLIDDNTSTVIERHLSITSTTSTDKSGVRVSVNNTMNDKSIKLNNMQTKLLNLSTKNTIICGIAALYFAFRFGYRQFAVRYDEDENTEPIWMISYVSRTFVFITNSIAVYFGFAFATGLYYKIFGKCHNCLDKLCKKLARRQITNNVVKEVKRHHTRELELNSIDNNNQSEKPLSETEETSKENEN